MEREVIGAATIRRAGSQRQNGKPIAGSAQARGPAFAVRTVAETCELLATVPPDAAPNGVRARGER